MPVTEEVHRRWSDNYAYRQRLKRSYKGRFVEMYGCEYLGRIYTQQDFTSGVEDAQKLKNALDL